MGERSQVRVEARLVTCAADLEDVLFGFFRPEASLLDAQRTSVATVVDGAKRWWKMSAL